MAGFVSERNWVSVIQNIEKGAADRAGCESVTTGGKVRVRVWTGGSVLVDDDDAVFVCVTVPPEVDPPALDCVVASESSSPLGRITEGAPYRDADEPDGCKGASQLEEAAP